MTHIKILGIDIAKDVFQLCGINREGKILYKKRVKREQYVRTVASLSVERVEMASRYLGLLTRFISTYQRYVLVK